jgi:hypothetical protein
MQDNSQTFYQWMQEQYDSEELSEIARHGCSSGCASGLIYYQETSAIYDRFADELHDKVTEYHSMTGSFPEFIIENFATSAVFKNAMVWFVAELYADELI